MSGVLPTSEVEAVDNGLGTITRPAIDIAVFFGVSSKGPMGPRTVTLATIESVYGTGPLVKKAAYAMKRANRKAIAMRLPKRPKGPVIGDVDVTGIAGTARPTVTGTPNRVCEIRVEVSTGGMIGQALDLVARFTLDGGATWSDAAPLDGEITLGASGLTANLTAGETFEEGDFFTCLALPGAGAVLAQTLTRANKTKPSTASMAASGSPEDDSR